MKQTEDAFVLENHAYITGEPWRCYIRAKQCRYIQATHKETQAVPTFIRIKHGLL
jgi:hypothetical protein